MSTTLNLTAFQEESHVLAETAKALGRFRRYGNQEEFLHTLSALGMSTEESIGMWEDMVPGERDSDGQWTDAESNSSLAEYFGILLHSARQPRNLLVYRLLELHFPDLFQIRVTGTIHMGGNPSRGNPPQRRLVWFDRKLVNGKGDQMAAYKVYQGEMPLQFSAHVVRAAGSLRDALGEELGLQLAELLFNIKVLIPPMRIAQLLADVITAGQKGKEIVLVGAFCPDYAYEPTGNPHVPYRYTFDGVGFGVGLVAQQFARIVPSLCTFLEELGIKHRVVLGIGDFEADSQAVLDRVGLSRQEFINRCRMSLAAFRRQVPANVPIKLELCGEQRSNGRLRPYAALASRNMQAGNLGRMLDVYSEAHEIVARIPEQYRTFYGRWQGRHMDDAEIRQLVLAQGGEYAAMARIYFEDFGPNVIMLSGDRPEMHCFGAFYIDAMPVLCAKRAY